MSSSAKNDLSKPLSEDEPQGEEPQGSSKSALWSVGKYILALTLLAFILKNAGTDEVLVNFRRIPPEKLLIAFVLITLAQFSSAMRMRFFFTASGFRLNSKFAIILFYVGSFYNFLLPGGIGGDAYKVILVRKRLNITTKDGIRIMLADRASGLLVIMLTMFAGMLMLDFSSLMPYTRELIFLCVAVTLVGYLFFSYWLLRKSFRIMLGSLPYSVATQSLWIAGLFTVCSALSGAKYAVEYMVLYCAAGIAGMLPISVGGLGVKEMTYFYGARFLKDFAHSGVDGKLGIAISLCLFMLMLVASLPGLLWLNKVVQVDYE